MLDTYRLHLTPLSPLHVGTGESYEPTNYVIEDDVLHEFDTGAVVDALSAKDRKELLDIGSRRPNAEMIQALQRFFYERRKDLMTAAVQRIPVLPGVARLYAQRVGQTANREADGKKVLNRLEIDRTSFNPVTRLPVLFGSSIKGAIRTALLDEVNKGAGLQQIEDRRSGKRRNENNQELQNRLFQYRAGKFELDPMRLIQLADAVWAGEPGLPAAQVQLAVNRKKAPVVDTSGKLRASQAESKDLYQILECVPGFHYRAFCGQLNIQSVAGLGERHAGKLPAQSLRFDAAQIARACNAFYLPILEAEIKLLRERGYVDAQWVKTLETLLAETKAEREAGTCFLLRVGRHSGAESVTLNGVRNIKILLEKDPKTKKQNFTYEPDTRTLWLAADYIEQSQNLLPFGWVLAELSPLRQSGEDSSKLRALCEPHLAEARKLRERFASLETERAAQQAALAQRRAEEAARAQAEAEKAAQKEQAELERQKRLAAMTPNSQAVEAFKAEFEARAAQLRGSKDRPNTAFHDKARALAKTALESPDWTAEEKRAAAEAIAEWLPKVVAVDMKDERKKLKLAALRGEV